MNDFQRERIKNALFEACEAAQTNNLTPAEFLKMIREAWRESRLRTMESDTYYFKKLVL